LNGNGGNGPKWSKLETWLQFYHTLCSDEAKVAYAHKDKIFPRAKLDASGNKHSSAPDCWSQVVTDKFNDSTWIAESKALPDLHNIFSESLTVKLEDVEGTITTEQVES
jgi:hypothetical protein